MAEMDEEGWASNGEPRYYYQFEWSVRRCLLDRALTSTLFCESQILTSPRASPLTRTVSFPAVRRILTVVTSPLCPGSVARTPRGDASCLISMRESLPYVK